MYGISCIYAFTYHNFSLGWIMVILLTILQIGSIQVEINARGTTWKVPFWPQTHLFGQVVKPIWRQPGDFWWSSDPIEDPREEIPWMN